MFFFFYFTFMLIMLSVFLYVGLLWLATILVLSLENKDKPSGKLHLIVVPGKCPETFRINKIKFKKGLNN